MKKSNIYRWLFYIIGLLVLALGIILNTKVSLGVSPIISVSYSFSTVLDLNFGNTTLVLYGAFVVAEMILHIIEHVRGKDIDIKSTLIKDVLQFPLSIVFTRFMNIFSALIPVFSEVYPDKFIGSFIGRMLILFIAIVFTGIGAAMSLNMRLIPNPGDGIVQAIADTAGKSVGFMKNCFDVFNICVTIIVSLILAGHLIGIGIGTVIAVIGVGRVVAVFNHLFKDKMDVMITDTDDDEDYELA